MSKWKIIKPGNMPRLGYQVLLLYPNDCGHVVKNATYANLKSDCPAWILGKDHKGKTTAELVSSSMAIYWKYESYEGIEEIPSLSGADYKALPSCSPLNVFKHGFPPEGVSVLVWLPSEGDEDHEDWGMRGWAPCTVFDGIFCCFCKDADYHRPDLSPYKYPVYCKYPDDYVE